MEILFLLLVLGAIGFAVYNRSKKSEPVKTASEATQPVSKDPVVRDEETAMQRATRIMDARKGDEEPVFYPGSTDDSGYEKDNWESFDFDNAQESRACGSYKIHYTDQAGLKTEREIEVKRVHSLGDDCAIYAYCRKRMANRTFIDSRVSKAVDLETGEVVNSVARHAILQYKKTDEAKVEDAIEKDIYPILILTFVCRADGRMLKAERGVIAEFIIRRSPFLNGKNALLDEAIKKIGSPSLKEFRNFVSDLRKAEDFELLNDLYACAQKIVATQKTIDPMEKAALEVLAKAAEK
ncbi:MAG: hypothetical protein RBS35_05725 [Azonexus sp.]|jgi:hypothetical protein|nr:hypothetical protein [Azonexus sp.]